MILRAFLGLLGGLLLAWAAHAVVPVVDPASLVPRTEQKQATRLITRFLSQYHYRKTPLDDELSSQIFERYLESLDPSRSYLLAEDIRELEFLRYRFDDLLSRARLEPAFRVFRLFRRRMEEATAHAIALLAGDFDFTRDEEYVYERSDAPWPADRAERDEIWRKRVKYDYLTLRLTGKEDDEIRTTLRQRYQRVSRRIAQLEPNDVYQLFMNAYAGTVEPHTAYFSPRTSENFKIHLSLSLEGIGAALRTEDEHTVVQRVIPGGPASESGQVHPEDRITGVAQGGEPMVDVVAWRLEDVVDLIRGPKGTEVRLEVLSKDSSLDGPRKQVRLLRDTIKLEDQAAKKWHFEVPHPQRLTRVGVIDVPSFYMDVAGEARGDEDYRSTTRDVRRLINELVDEGVDGLVIDLRGNGGGALSEAVQLTGLFIEKGPVVQVRDTSGRLKVERDPDPGIAYRGPLAVLVDRYSASASEIFAGAMQDYGRALVLGEPTFGKGTVQSLVDLDRFVKRGDKKLGQLKTTIAQFFRVNGASTQHRGVVPDIVFPTAFDIDDHGERSLDNALPWASVQRASYSAVPVRSGELDELRKRHDTRMATDPVFGLLLAEARARKRIRDANHVTLVEARRKAEQEARSDVRKARMKQLKALMGLPEDEEDEDGEHAEHADALDIKENKQADAWLREATKILADYVAVSTEPGHHYARSSVVSAAPPTATRDCLLEGC